MGIISEKIQVGCQQLNVSFSEQQVDKLEAYIHLLVKWNKSYNLTAIRDPEKMVVYHLLDSIVLQDYFFEKQHSVLDVGSGAGLPGIPLSIVFPDKDFTLLDSNGKKTRFMTQAKLELGLENCNVLQHRVEKLVADQPFKVIVSRAFATLADFVNSTVHLIDNQGMFYAMKGKVSPEELEDIPSSVRLVKIEPLNVPMLSEQRHLVVLEKQTDNYRGPLWVK